MLDEQIKICAGNERTNRPENEHLISRIVNKTSKSVIPQLTGKQNCLANPGTFIAPTSLTFLLSRGGFEDGLEETGVR